MTSINARREATSFKSEVDLCSAFLSLLPDDYQSFAETGGWDILLVRKLDGLQIGIQAKLSLNETVVTQAIAGATNRAQGPDCRAVLIPDGKARFSSLLQYIGVVCITVRRLQKQHGYWLSSYKANDLWEAQPDLPKQEPSYTDDIRWPEWFPIKPVALPEFIPDVAAGASAPRQLSEWKIKSLKLLAILNRRGWVNRRDFKALGLSPSQWCSPGGWLSHDAANKRYIRSDRTPALDQHHPRVWPEIMGSYDDWIKTLEPPGAPRLFEDWQ